VIRRLAGTTVALALLLAAPAGAATIGVNTTVDQIDANDGQCSLREAVESANGNAISGGATGECPAGDPGQDTLALGTGTFVLDKDDAIPGNSSDDLAVLESLTIQGQGADATTIDVNLPDRAILVDRLCRRSRSPACA
jgi:CSLREA domain-containing protein